MFNARRFVPPFPVNKPQTFYANLTINRSIANATGTIVIYDNVVTIDNNYYSYNNGTGVLTIINTGIYVVTGNANWVVNVTGERRLNGVINDGVARAHVGFLVPATVGINTVSFMDIVSAVNATANITAFQSSGGALNISASQNSYFMVSRLGDL